MLDEVSVGTVKNNGAATATVALSGAFRRLGTSAEIGVTIHRLEPRIGPAKADEPRAWSSTYAVPFLTVFQSIDSLFLRRHWWKFADPLFAIDYC